MRHNPELLNSGGQNLSRSSWWSAEHWLFPILIMIRTQFAPVSTWPELLSSFGLKRFQTMWYDLTQLCLVAAINSSWPTCDLSQSSVWASMMDRVWVRNRCFAVTAVHHCHGFEELTLHNPWTAHEQAAGRSASVGSHSDSIHRRQTLPSVFSAG